MRLVDHNFCNLQIRKLLNSMGPLDSAHRLSYIIKASKQNQSDFCNLSMLKACHFKPKKHVYSFIP